MLDTDENGTISREELLHGYVTAYQDSHNQAEIEAKVKEMWDHVDFEGGVEVDYTEWALATINKSSLLTEARLREAFSMFDEKDTGFITA